jgi:hypothetical protein
VWSSGRTPPPTFVDPRLGAYTRRSTGDTKVVCIATARTEPLVMSLRQGVVPSIRSGKGFRH